MQDSGEEGGSSQMASWNGKQWVNSESQESGSNDTSMVHIQAGCETWVSNYGLDEAFDALSVEEAVAAE